MPYEVEMIDRALREAREGMEAARRARAQADKAVHCLIAVEVYLTNLRAMAAGDGPAPAEGDG